MQVMEKLFEASPSDKLMDAGKMALVFQVASLQTLQGLLGAFLEMAKSAGELIAVASVDNFRNTLANRRPSGVNH